MLRSIVEQLKTENDPFTRAKLIRSLIHDHNLRLKDISKELLLKPAYICHYLRLNKLPEIIIDGFYSKDITLSHLFIVSRLKEQSQMIEVYEKILSKNMTVLQTEETVREMLYHIKTEGETLTREEKAGYESKLPEDVRMTIVQTRIKSKLIFEIKGSLSKTTKAIRALLDKVAP